MELKSVLKNNVDDFVEEYGRLGDLVLLKIAVENNLDNFICNLVVELFLGNHDLVTGSKLTLWFTDVSEFVYRIHPNIGGTSVISIFNVAIIDGITYLNLSPVLELSPSQCEVSDFSDSNAMIAAQRLQWKID